MPSPCECAARAPPGEQRLSQHLNAHHLFSNALTCPQVLIGPWADGAIFYTGQTYAPWVQQVVTIA